ncbi:redoxin domain-containing protein [Longimicrobium sp.]|uniref:redoxin domain-containing protein n=1 Tax=Longimicrobium sp. TaxID=2029185 RepID=UPI002E37A1E2|nr:redoxin domain-containing protein [Longimicrobium sp.]HEX6038641.1 redoxin domain-containing protein [Longimicrobium sp.]
MEEIADRPRLARGERLPDLQLASAPDGSTMPLVAPGGRQVPVVVVLDDAECDACRAYLRRLAVADEEMRAWDGRVVAVVPGSVEDAARVMEAVDPPFPVLADPERTLWQRMRVDDAAVLVADPWGEARFRHEAGAAHDVPEPAELVDWARFMAIQCPECEGESL